MNNQNSAKKLLTEKLVEFSILTHDLKFSKRGKHLLLNKHPDLLDEVLAETSFVWGNTKETLRERIFVILHEIESQPLCVVCKTPVSFRKDGVAVGYPETCSRECSVKNPQRQKRRQATSLEKYGTRLPQEHETVKEKARQTSLKRYGVFHKNQTHIDKENFEKLNNNEWLFEQHYEQKRTLSDIADELKVNVTTIQRYLNKHGLTTQHFFQSDPEKDIIELLDKHGITFIKNDRTVIRPHELDIFIPSNNLAIEYCGLYWHSEQMGKDKWYHRNKFEHCNNKGIQLLTIFSDEWETRRSVVEHTILHKLGKNTSVKKYARVLKVVDVDLQQKENFLNRYHIQGSGDGSITYGLSDDDELYAVITFKKQPNNVFILNRYATSCLIPGGFTKLLAHFIKNHDWSQIVTFADLRWSDGNVYRAAGFREDKILPPDYYYCPTTHTRLHKFNFRRKYLPKRLEFFDPNLSERQNCDNNNILRIWDCGKIRFVLEK